MIEIKTNIGYANGFYDYLTLITNLCLSGFEVSSFVMTEVCVSDNETPENLYLSNLLYANSIAVKINGKIMYINSKIYSFNCALLFLNDTDMDEETFNFFVGSAGYTFVFSNWNLFYKSIKLYNNLYLYHIESKTKYTSRSVYIGDKNAFSLNNTVYATGFFKHDKNITNGGIFMNKPFYNLDLNFIFGINNVTFYNYYEKSFLVYIPSLTQNVEDYYNTVYEAYANRTKNKLKIAISKDVV